MGSNKRSGHHHQRHSVVEKARDINQQVFPRPRHPSPFTQHVSPTYALVKVREGLFHVLPPHHLTVQHPQPLRAMWLVVWLLWRLWLVLFPGIVALLLLVVEHVEHEPPIVVVTVLEHGRMVGQELELQDLTGGQLLLDGFQAQPVPTHVQSTESREHHGERGRPCRPCCPCTATATTNTSTTQVLQAAPTQIQVPDGMRPP